LEGAQISPSELADGIGPLSVLKDWSSRLRAKTLTSSDDITLCGPWNEG
jgi:hypothetical protein